MDYGEVITRAWHIIWKHKILWVFGILSGCSSAANTRPNPQYTLSRSDWVESPPEWLVSFARWLSEGGWETFIIAVICLMILLLVILLVAGALGQVGLIHGAARADQEDEPRLRFGEVLRGSLPHFWRVLVLNLLVGLVSFIFLIVFIALLAFTFAFAFNNFENSSNAPVWLLGTTPLLVICLCCLFFPLTMVLSVVLLLTTNAIVVDNLGIIAGFRQAIRLLRSHLGQIAVVFVIQFVVGIAVGIVLAGLSLPVTMGSFGLAMSGVDLTAGLLILLICWAAILPVVLLVAGVFQSYIQSLWTVTYLRLTGRHAYRPPAVTGPETPLQPLPENYAKFMSSTRPEAIIA